MSSDVIVAGGGMAGLTAAISARQHGAARVRILEKAPVLGGSMRLSNGNFSTFGSVDDAAELGGGGDAALQRIVMSELADGISWLRSLGIEISDAGSSHREYIGWKARAGQLLERLSEVARELDIEITLDAGLDQLLCDEGGHVRATRVAIAGRVETLETGAVILATGGFQGDARLVREYLGAEAEFAYHRANAWSSGDGLLAALDIGAATSVGMDTFYGHSMPAAPASVNEKNFTDVTQYYGSTAVAINLRGERFVDESRGVFEENVNWALARQPRATGFYVVDGETLVSGAPRTPEAVIARSEAAGGVVFRESSLAALAERLAEHGVSRAVALRTLTEYDDAVRTGTTADLPIPRTRHRVRLGTAPFVAIKVTAGITMTTGGLAVDEGMRVLRRAASTAIRARDARHGVVSGLYAAGTDVGAISHHGYFGGLPTALTTGFRAGRSAAGTAG